MSAELSNFTTALDKAFRSFLQQEVELEQPEVKVLTDRGILRVIQQKFQRQLQRARAAFLQEFRNHAVIVDAEAEKIRAELSAAMKEQYSGKIARLQAQTAEACDLVMKHRAEVAQLKELVAAQETYLAAVRHRTSPDVNNQLRDSLEKLEQELEQTRTANRDLSHQLMCRDQLVSQLQAQVDGYNDEMAGVVHGFDEEKRLLEAEIQGLRAEMLQQQEVFREHLQNLEAKFTECREKAAAEVHIQDILHKRRAEAMAQMEEERARWIQARSKPSPRIGQPPEQEHQEQFEDYSTTVGAKTARYRVDEMGMDTSWRDYHLSERSAAKANRQAPFKFRTDRIRKVVPSPGMNSTFNTTVTSMFTPRLPPTVGSILAGTC